MVMAFIAKTRQGIEVCINGPEKKYVVTAALLQGSFWARMLLRYDLLNHDALDM